MEVQAFKPKNMTNINMRDNSSPIICLLGPTASGKTRLGVALAKALNAEIISADSRQVYKEMDIGTGKDLDEYEDVPYHLIDICEPKGEYNLFSYLKDFNEAHQRIEHANKTSLVVGGTGMYLDALLNRYCLTEAKTDETEALRALDHGALKQRLLEINPKQHNTSDLLDPARTLRALEIEYAKRDKRPIIQAQYSEAFVLGILTPREQLKQKITKRLKQRLEEGMIEEVKHLTEIGISWDKLHFFGLEYRFVAEYLQGSLNYNDMFQKLNAAIHRFSKQQEKWFRNIEKKGTVIHWLDSNHLDFSDTAARCQSFLDKHAK